MQKKLTPIATPRAGIFVIQPSLMLYSTKGFHRPTDQSKGAFPGAFE
jgi:hypothetical protein